MAKKILKFLFIFIFFCISVIGIKMVYAQDIQARHYEITLTYDENKTLTYDGFSTITDSGLIESIKEKKDFLSKLYSFDDKVLTESYFNPENNGKFILKLPYYPTGKIIKVFNKTRDDILDINVQVFAKVCGDGECQGHEYYKICPEDCPSGGKDDYCDKQADEICDPDCNNIKDYDPDCTGVNRTAIYQKLRKEAEQKKVAPEEKVKSNQKKPSAEKPYFKTFIFFIVLIIVIVLVILSFLLRGRKEEG